jgi:hypothetical protein
MKQFIFCLFLFSGTNGYSQRVINNYPNPKVYRSAYLDQPAVFVMGKDSCQRFYFTHFMGFDSLLQMLVRRGDTVKFIRVHFSFVIDRYGIVSNPHFIKISATAYGKSRYDRELIYFRSNKSYWNGLVKQMLSEMGFWKPGLLNGKPVDCLVDDYMQFWVGRQMPE